MTHPQLVIDLNQLSPEGHRTLEDIVKQSEQIEAMKVDLEEMGQIDLYHRMKAFSDRMKQAYENRVDAPTTRKPIEFNDEQLQTWVKFSKYFLSYSLDAERGNYVRYHDPDLGDCLVAAPHLALALVNERAESRVKDAEINKWKNIADHQRRTAEMYLSWLEGLHTDIKIQKEKLND